MLCPDGCAPIDQEAEMAEKNKGGREARKPKADKNKKAKGQTPPPRSAALDTINHTAAPSK
jgi:hypothetical protein